MAERGPDRAEEDHAVDALPHGRARAHAVDGVRVRAEERQRRSARPVGISTCPPGTVLIPNFTACKAALIVLTWTAGTALVMWLGELITQRGIGNGMSILIFTSVVSRLPYQGALVLKQSARSSSSSILVIAVGDDPRRSCTVESGQRRIPSAIRETSRRPPHVRRPEHLHPAEGQPVGCDPGDLRELAALVPGAHRDRAARGTASRWINDNLVGNAARSAGSTSCAFGVADPVLLVLLHGDRVQPAATGRHHPQAGRVHPRHPARAADRALPRQGAEPHHVARRAVPDGHRAASRSSC